MATLEKEVIVPDLGDFKEVEIIEVLVKVGDTIQPEQSLITLESDKAAMEVPSPFGGVVTSILVKPGDRVKKDSLICHLNTLPSASKLQDTVDLAAEIPSTASSVLPADSTPLLSEKVVVVPDLGGFKNIEVIEVLVKPGDTVHAEDSLITLESDKAAMEVPCPWKGTVKMIKVAAGDRVSTGTPILILSDVLETESHKINVIPPSSPHSLVSPSEKPALPSQEKPSSRATKNIPPHASPAVRRFARELGANLHEIQGTGPKGRILKENVQQFIKERLQQVATVPTVSLSTPTFPFALPPLPEIDFSQFGPIEKQALSRIQKLSGPYLHRNWLSIPHITQHEEVDITELENFRQSLKAEASSKGIKVSLLPFVMKALVSALKQYPSFNASLENDGKTLILKHYFHIGVAVDTPQGLVVPVVPDVDKKSIFMLAAELAEVSEKARAGKLRQSDLEGGCCTISSLGGIGGTAFTPIINAPEVAILGLSKSKIQPQWQENQFVPRRMVPLSLSYDHRVIDGAQAARFIVYLGELLTDLRRILLY